MQALVGGESEADQSSESEGESECMAEDAEDAEGLRAQHATTPNTTGKEPREGTAAWWLKWRECSILPNVDTSVKRMCYMLADWKCENRTSDHAFDTLCNLFANVVFGNVVGNMFPPSFHLVKAVLEVPPAASCRRHICDKCWTLFPPLNPDEYKQHATDACDQVGCGNDRFEKTIHNKIVPKRCVYDFGIEETVTDLLFATPDLLLQLANNRKAEFDDPASFLSSPAGRMLDARCGYMISNPRPNEIVVLLSLGTP